MRRIAWWLPLLLAACAAGEDGAPGPDGEPGRGSVPCTARIEEGGWTIECPDGSSARLEFGGCVENEGPEGTRVIRCADGSEAVVRPAETPGNGSIRGVAELAGRVAAAGATVELAPSGRTTTVAADGSFSFVDVAPGRYDLTVSLPPWIPLTVEGIHVLPGTWDVGTVTLDLVRDLGAFQGEGTWEISKRLSQEGQLYLFRARWEVRELAADRDLPVEPPPFGRILEAEWVGPETLVLEGWTDEGRTIGLWTSAAGTRWVADADFVDGREGAILVSRLTEEGRTYWYVGPDGETRVDLPEEAIWTSGGPPQQLWFFLVPGERIYVVDGRAGKPEVRSLEIPSVDGVQTVAGDLVALLSTDSGSYLWDLASGESWAMGETSSMQLAPGRAAWIHAETGRLRAWDDVSREVREYGNAALMYGWTESGRWLYWEEVSGTCFVHEVGAASPIVVAGVDAYAFSPSERWLASVVPGAVVFHDLESGVTRTVLADVWYCDWIDESEIVCGAEQAVRIGIDGSLESLGEFYGYWAWSGGFLLWTEDGARVWRAGASEPIELRDVVWAMPAVTGDALAWAAPPGMVYVLDLSTGNSHPIGIAEMEPLALDDGLFLLLGRYEERARLAWAPWP